MQWQFVLSNDIKAPGLVPVHVCEQKMVMLIDNWFLQSIYILTNFETMQCCKNAFCRKRVFNSPRCFPPFFKNLVSTILTVFLQICFSIYHLNINAVLMLLGKTFLALCSLFTFLFSILGNMQILSSS